LFSAERDCINAQSPANIELLAEALLTQEAYTGLCVYLRKLQLDGRIKQAAVDFSKIFIRQFVPSQSKRIMSMLNTYMIEPEPEYLINAQMAYYRHPSGGHVFSAGACQWNQNIVSMKTMRERRVMSRIFRNILDKFGVVH